MDRVDRLERLKVFLKNQPLIEAEPSIAAIKPKLLNKKGGNLFFGVGVVTSEDISTGVPFDILAMFFTSELIRKFINLNKVIVLIGDSHAKSNRNFSDKQIDEITIKTKNILTRIINNFNLTDFKLILASEMDKNKDFQKILSDLPNMENEYLKREIADCLFFQKTENLVVKLGWTMEKRTIRIGHDERFFDGKISKFCPDLSFVHLKPGHTFNKERPRVSPYLAIKGEKRIMLKNGENVALKISLAEKEWQNKQLGGARKHLVCLVRAFEKLNEPLFGLTLEEKIQFILDKAVA